VLQALNCLLLPDSPTQAVIEAPSPWISPFAGRAQRSVQSRSPGRNAWKCCARLLNTACNLILRRRFPLCGCSGRRIPGSRRTSYSAAEIASLLEAAKALSPKEGLRPVTYLTLFGLIAATGLRVSEARSLTRADVEFDRAVLTVRNTKFRKSRLVPLHPTTIGALQRYAEIRDRKVPLVDTAAFFVSDRGKALDKRTVHYTFAKLRQQLGWRARGGHPAPRIHDLRHTFICQALLRSCRKRRSPEHGIEALSTYVGHAKVTYTYWYVTGIPELMALAARRFERFAHGDSQ